MYIVYYIYYILYNNIKYTNLTSNITDKRACVAGKSIAFFTQFCE